MSDTPDDIMTAAFDTWNSMRVAEGGINQRSIIARALMAEREAATKRERERAGWQPIETAPKDGTEIILFCPQGDGTAGKTYRVTSGQWCDEPGGTTEYRGLDGSYLGQDDSDGFCGWLSWDGGFSEDTMMPTHWMPLPAPPVIEW